MITSSIDKINNEKMKFQFIFKFNKLDFIAFIIYKQYTVYVGMGNGVWLNSDWNWISKISFWDSSGVRDRD